MNPTAVNPDWWVERSRANMAEARLTHEHEVALLTMRALAGKRESVCELDKLLAGALAPDKVVMAFIEYVNEHYGHGHTTSWSQH